MATRVVDQWGLRWDVPVIIGAQALTRAPAKDAAETSRLIPLAADDTVTTIPSAHYYLVTPTPFREPPQPGDNIWVWFDTPSTARPSAPQHARNEPTTAQSTPVLDPSTGPVGVPPAAVSAASAEWVFELGAQALAGVTGLDDPALAVQEVLGGGQPIDPLVVRGVVAAAAAAGDVFGGRLTRELIVGTYRRAGVFGDLSVDELVGVAVSVGSVPGDGEWNAFVQELLGKPGQPVDDAEFGAALGAALMVQPTGGWMLAGVFGKAWGRWDRSVVGGWVGLVERVMGVGGVRAGMRVFQLLMLFGRLLGSGGESVVREADLLVMRRLVEFPAISAGSVNEIWRRWGVFLGEVLGRAGGDVEVVGGVVLEEVVHRELQRVMFRARVEARSAQVSVSEVWDRWGGVSAWEVGDVERTGSFTDHGPFEARLLLLDVVRDVGGLGGAVLEEVVRRQVVGMDAPGGAAAAALGELRMGVFRDRAEASPGLVREWGVENGPSPRRGPGGGVDSDVAVVADVLALHDVVFPGWEVSEEDGANIRRLLYVPLSGGRPRWGRYSEVVEFAEGLLAAAGRVGFGEFASDRAVVESLVREGVPAAKSRRGHRPVREEDLRRVWP
ncbi:hypothetical protein, partial [Rhizomonospora bruguierae]|uniref:hypothetical protein n=1 Tax=Rhizomonospora bruguierae TaxID=1581705 RepID=UPI001BCC7E44